MTFGKSCCFLCCCFMVVLQVDVLLSQDISMSPPSKAGWVNPDDLFGSKEAPLPESLPAPEDIDISMAEQEENSVDGPKQSAFCSFEESTAMGQEDSSLQVQEDEANAAAVYLRRFIRILLEVSGLDEGDLDQINTAEIKISISEDHLKTLRQFTKDGITKSMPLRKVDEIFAAVFVKPYFNLPMIKIDSLMDKFHSFGSGGFFFSGVLPAVWFLSVLLITGSVKKSFVWFMPVVFATSYCTTTYRMFEEAQLKQYETIKSHPDIPAECRTNTVWAYLFGKGDCTKYLQAHHIDANLHVTPVKVLTQMFGETVAETMAHIGVGSVGFLGPFSELGFITQIILVPFGVVILYTVGVLICLVITGGTIRLPYFMGSMSFHQPNKDEHVTSNQGASASNRVEATPSTSNITYNFNMPLTNANEILQSLTGANRNSNQPPQLLAASDLGHPSYSSLVGGGDGLHATQRELSEHCKQSLPQKAPGRQGPCYGSKKLHKQFSQLESKYKSNSKFSKVRKMSL